MPQNPDGIIPRRAPIMREHLLQSHVRSFARDGISLPPDRYLFLGIDSAQRATENQRARMAARGILAGTPDTFLFVDRAMPVVIELKWGRNPLSEDQKRILAIFAALGCGTGVARSVVEYAEILHAEGVPLRAQWSVIAQDLDLKVLARIARLESRAPGGSPARSAKPKPRFSAGKRLAASMNARRIG